MSESENDRKLIHKLLVICSIVVALVALVALFFFSPLRIFVGVSIAMHQIHKQEDLMQIPTISSLAATNLALYCQSSESLKITDMIDASRLPPPMPRLGRPWAEFTPSNATVEFGGGFYHYGYSMELDTAKSGAGINVWHLFLCREESPDLLLHTCTLPDTARYPVIDFLSNSLSEYDARIKATPDDLNLFKAKINLLLQLDHSQVRPACTNLINIVPNHWWPRLTLALLDTWAGNAAEASSNLVKFVQSQPSYSRYIYLAYFYQLIDKPDDAARAVEKAISYPIVDLDTDDLNTECRGYSAGIYLYQVGKYSTVVKLCDALLPIKANGNYAKSALLGLKTAAMAASAGSTPAFTPSKDVLGFNPYENFDLAALMAH